MNEYNYEELIASADAAFANKQYSASLEYYRKALEQRPDELYPLSRAGSLSIVLKQYDDAFRYLTHATEVDPNNGDNYYNLGNAYYFMKDYTRCLDLYTKAEMLGCSPEVLDKLYFQKSMLCSARGDVKSALMYLKKYEKAHADDIKSMDPRIFEQKVKLQLACNQYEEAELSAAKLLNIQPTRFQNYIIYFNLLMALKKYEQAEKVLIDAREYAELSSRDEYVLGIQQAAFYTELVDVFADDEENRTKCERFASDIYNKLLNDDNPEVSKNEVKLNLANLHMKAKRYDEAIAALLELLPSDELKRTEADLSEVEEYVPFASDDEEAEPDEPDELDELGEDDEFDEFAQNDSDELDEFDEEAEPDEFDEEDENEYAESEEEAVEPEDEEEDVDAEAEPESGEELTDEFIERVRYILMSCYVSKEAFVEALGMTKYLKDSENVFYRYFSRYCEAYSIRSLAGSAPEYTKELGEQKYAEAIAFYRSRMLENPKDKYAIVLRARLYAEQGSYVKAEEMTKLLGAEERGALKEYIEKCRVGGEA